MLYSASAIITFDEPSIFTPNAFGAVASISNSVKLRYCETPLPIAELYTPYASVADSAFI